MKNILIPLLLTAISSCSNNPSALKTDLEGKSLPSFNFLLMDSTTQMNTNSIPYGKPFVLFFFSPYCPYCRAQTEQMIADMNVLSNIQFYFLSPFPFAPVKKYYAHYGLKKYANIILGQDYKNYIGSYFNANEVPYMALYDKEKRLKKVYIGNVGTGVIKDIAIK
jgi:protein-disulfide isomerase